MNSLSSVKRTVVSGGTSISGLLLCRPVKLHGSGLWARVLRECRTLIPEACWKLFCTTLAGLLLSLHKGAASCWADGLLQPCLTLQLVYLTQISQCSSFHQMLMNYRQQSTRESRGGMLTMCSVNAFSLRSSWEWTWHQRVR